MTSGWIGLALLPLLGLGLARTGWAAWEVLLGVSVLGMLLGVLLGADAALLYALPSRLTGLLDNDLLQALPMFVLMGLLLDRLRVPAALFATGADLLGRRAGRAPSLALAVGALLGPLNGSAGASVASMARSVAPQLARRGVGTADRFALVAVAGTFGVLVPPSLVLILLGDALLGAHTLALNATGRLDRVINTQDLMRGALLPALLLVLLTMVTARLAVRVDPMLPQAPAASSRGQRLLAAAVVAGLVLLLGLIAAGRLRPVEGVAAATVALLLLGAARGRLRAGRLAVTLRRTLELSGALFALLLAATTFTLTLRLLGTDAVVAAGIAALPDNEILVALIALLAIAAVALVLDAFELIFVVVPLLLPPVLARVPDAQWVGVLVLLTLQASFLLPPFGYALLMARGVLRTQLSTRQIVRALWPFLLAQWLVLALVLTFPRLAHLGGAPGAEHRDAGLDGRDPLIDALPPPETEAPELPQGKDPAPR